MESLGMTDLLTDFARLETLTDKAIAIVEDSQRLLQERDRIRQILKTFYQAPVSASTLQPVLDLAVELNPELKGTR